MNAYELLNTGKGPTARDVLNALRVPRGVSRAHGISVRATRDPSAPHYSRDCATFNLGYTRERYDREAGRSVRLSEHSIDVPGRIGNGSTDTRETLPSSHGSGTYTRYCETFEPTSGYWSLYASDARLIDALECVSPLAIVRIEVRLDWLTTPNLTSLALHGDALSLIALEPRKSGEPKRREFLIDTSTGPHNSARFGVSR